MEKEVLIVHESIEDNDLRALQNFLCGRIWHEDFLPFEKSVLKKAEKRNWIKKIDGLQIYDGKRVCSRCRCEESHFYVDFYCAKCHSVCTYCRNCIRMKRVASCDQLIIWTGPKPTITNKVTFDWRGTFTDAQARVSEQLVESVMQKQSRLVHAVCGAGKTEILFSAIQVALERGDRVCVATPRTDVVLELIPRFQQVFPDTTIHALYGGAEVSVAYAPLVIATTHQLYRFQRAFDIIFVDEADAFPYTYDRSLQIAVEKAVKKDGAIMFVTATPSIEMLTRFKKKRAYSFIPRRFHGFDLPVPTFESLWFYDKQLRVGRVPKKLTRWIEKCERAHKPYLIFFPTIDLMEKSAHLFDVPYVYAEEPERKQKVMQLRNGEIKGLLTTTILERGITIPSLQVAVLGAENAIFTSSALIQISGRVGRAAHDPTGDIVFFHHGITSHMDDARQEIMRLNRM